MGSKIKIEPKVTWVDGADVKKNVGPATKKPVGGEDNNPQPEDIPMVKLSEGDTYAILNSIKRLPLEDLLLTYKILTEALQKAFPNRVK